MVTRAAGKALLLATLSWPHPVLDPALTDLPETLASMRCTVSKSEEGTSLRLEVEAAGTTRRGLAATLDGVLRAVAAHAALTDAVFEVAVARRQEPRVASRRALEVLASGLSRAGFRVRFAQLEAPAPAADVWVGTGGDEGRLEDFLHSHPLWKTP